jgi:hypothetical protein
MFFFMLLWVSPHFEASLSLLWEPEQWTGSSSGPERRENMFYTVCSIFPTPELLHLNSFSPFKFREVNEQLCVWELNTYAVSRHIYKTALKTNHSFLQ